jgi:PDZ domain
MRHILIAPILLIFASHQATAQESQQTTAQGESSQQTTAQGESSQRAYLGVHLAPGAQIANVDNNGPAQVSGLEPGDLIVRFDGKEIRRPDDLTQIVADTPIGKEVAVTVIRGGKEEMTTVKLGQRLVLSGTALDAYRQKLDGMLQELESLGASKQSWDQPELQKFSELFEQFEELQKTVPPEDSVVLTLWGRLEREFKSYKSFADNIIRERNTQRGQATDPERRIEEQLGPLYVNYMILQVCGARFQQFDNARSGLRDFLKTKEGALPRELTDKVWNTIAAKFQTVEGELERAGNVQLYAECEQASKQATALIVAATGDATQGPPVRKKDF